MPHNTLKLQTKRVAHMKFLPLQLAQDHKANDPTGGRQGQSATATRGLTETCGGRNCKVKQKHKHKRNCKRKYLRLSVSLKAS